MKKLYIGIDAHKESNVVALAFAGRKDPELYGKAPADIPGFVKVLRKIVDKYGLSKEDVAICYEAGPTGFVLARRMRDLGFECEVVAPSLIPTRASDRIKTDRRDARKLSGLFRAGELTFVHVPDVIDEVIRDVCRARTDAVETQTRSRQQLGALLLRNGHRYTGQSTWGPPHMRYLRELAMPDATQKIVLEEYLQRIDDSVAQVQRFEQKMAEILVTWDRRPYVEALQGFRGFQLVASMVIISELGDLGRFKHPRQLMAYLGMVPSEASSGGKRHQGSITKSGNSHARWMLIEAAQHYRLPPKVSTEISKRQEGLSREVKAISWRAQERLNRRYNRLILRGLHRNKVIVAVARELLGFIWEMARVVQIETQARKVAPKAELPTAAARPPTSCGAAHSRSQAAAMDNSLLAIPVG
jgi:transposase